VPVESKYSVDVPPLAQAVPWFAGGPGIVEGTSKPITHPAKGNRLPRLHPTLLWVSNTPDRDLCE